MSQQHSVYVYPRLGGFDAWFLRVAGPGLGNMLFPWARAVVLARRRHFPIIAPTWPQIKAGPYLRREQDLRSYGGLFTSQHYISGVRRLRILTCARKVAEAEYDDSLSNALVVFSGMRGYFTEILKDWPLVWQELLDITKDPHKKALAYDFSNSISLHVRLGDQASDPRAPIFRRRIDIEWYVGVVEALRARLGRPLPVFVFSDGATQELAPLLALNGVVRLSFGSAIADLLALARAEILVASGSTFSMWASYLGRMPVVWHPQQLRQHLYETALEVEASADGDLPAPFLEALAAWQARTASARQERSAAG